MGYGVQRFRGRVDDNLLCSICSQVLEEAVLTPCGHSFCHQCLATWLTRPGCASCPQCRATVLPGQAKPILSLRSLISGLNISCEHSCRGCRVLTTLDSLASHLDLCAHAPIQCAGCSSTVSRSELPDHQIRCRAIAALLDDKADTPDIPVSPDRPLLRRSLSQPSSETAPSHDAALLDLSARVSSLELQLRCMKHDLQLADQKNQQLDLDLQRARQELENWRRDNLHQQQQQHQVWEPGYPYGYTSQSIAKLASLLLTYRNKKPNHIDANKVFECVRRCYDNFGHNRKEGSTQGDVDKEEERDVQERDDVHMLVATAQACGWFTENQRLNFHCWLQSIARHRQFFFIQNYK